MAHEILQQLKIFNFYLQKQLRSDRFSLSTPFFRRKNSAQ